MLNKNKGLYLIITLVSLFSLTLSACQPTPTATMAPATAKAATAAPATAAPATKVPATVAPATQAPAQSYNVPIPAPFGDATKKPRVALVRQFGAGSFFERYLAGAKSMADSLGIELVESNAGGDDAKMVTNLETAIQQKVDAIVVDHGRAEALTPGIEKAVAAGIKVVTFDLVVPDPAVTEIEQDDILIGYLVSKQLGVDFAGTANVIYANQLGFTPLDKRDKSWEVVKWRFPGLNQVAMVGKVSEATANDTQPMMEAAIKAHPEANAVLAMYDEFAKGVVRAIEAAGKQDQYKVYSVDVTAEDIQMMTAPNSPWKVTVATDSYNVGRLAVRAAAARLAGNPVPKYLLVQPAIITQDFLLANKVASMDDLVKALPALGESSYVWYDWMYKLGSQNK
jgi:simple sugar transport system substrate-binding protein